MDAIAFLSKALSGNHSHVTARVALEGLSPTIAGFRPEHAPHSPWQLLSHLNYWWEIFFAIVDGTPPPSAKTAVEGWKAEVAPPNAEALESAIRLHLENLDRAQAELGSKAAALQSIDHPYGNGLSILQTMAAHQSYHIGQIVLLRQMAGDWPPPSGGETW